MASPRACRAPHRPPPRIHVTTICTLVYTNMIVINLYSLEFLKSDHAIENATPAKTTITEWRKTTRKHRPCATHYRSRPALPQGMVDAESQSKNQMRTNARCLTAARSKLAPAAWPPHLRLIFACFQALTLTLLTLFSETTGLNQRVKTM